MASIVALNGIDHVRARKLRKNRIRTTEALLRRAATRKARSELASTIEVPEVQLLRWANRAELMKVKGIGPEYADILEAVGIDTVRELRRRKAKALTAAIVELNDQEHLVRRLPTEGMVERWISDAADLEPIVRA